MTSDLPMPMAAATAPTPAKRDMVQELRDVRNNLCRMRDALELSVLDLQRARAAAREELDR